MPDADVEGGGPHLEVAVHHAKDEAADDGHGRGPAQRHQPARDLHLALGAVQVPAHHHTWG